MSTDLKPVEDRNGRVSMTQFYGGTNDGTCLQITSSTADHPYISLTKDQAMDLAFAILDWVGGRRPKEDEE